MMMVAVVILFPSFVIIIFCASPCRSGEACVPLPPCWKQLVCHGLQPVKLEDGILVVEG